MKRKEGRVLSTRIQSVQVPSLTITDHQGFTPDKSVSFPFAIELKPKEKPKKKAPAPKKPAPAKPKGN